MGNAAAIDLDDVSIRYGKVLAVDRLTLEIPAGEIFGLLGPNGSGKSTTLAGIAGSLEPCSGTIRVRGITRHEQASAYASLIGHVPQEPALYEELSAAANLDFFASLHGVGRRERRRRIARILEMVELAERADDRVESYSGGMKRRLNLAAALLHDPAVLLLDEPTIALDPHSREVLYRVLHEGRERGKAIVLTTHLLDEAEQWCDRVGILKKGRLIACGRPADVMHDAADRSLLEGVLREELAEQMEVAIRRRLGPDIEFQVIGRRIHLAAPDAEQLGLSLAAVGAAGAEIESLRTPPARLERNEMDYGPLVTARGES